MVHDFATGIAIPGFVAMVASTMHRDLLLSVEPHVYALAGGLGIVTAIGQVLGPPTAH